jgi:hypothetical protein
VSDTPFVDSQGDGPLTRSELAELESTLLPALERHHLRLLAHALRTLQSVAGRNHGAPPSAAELEDWASNHAVLGEDRAFARVFLQQLEGAGNELAAIAAGLETSALALDLSQLCAWARARADDRLQRDSGG